MIDLGGDNRVKAFKEVAKDIEAALLEIENQNQVVKDLLAGVKEEFGLKPSMVKKAIKTIMKKNKAEVDEDYQSFTDLVETLESK